MIKRVLFCFLQKKYGLFCLQRTKQNQTKPQNSLISDLQVGKVIKSTHFDLTLNLTLIHTDSQPLTNLLPMLWVFGRDFTPQED